VAEPSTPVSPFNPPITQVPRGGPGCGKPLLIGCGVLALLFVGGLITVAVEWRAVLRGYFEVLDATLAPRLPADLSAAERDRLHRAFAGAADLDAANETELPALQRLQRRIVQLSGSQEPLSHRDVAELTADLEALHAAPRALPPGQGRPLSPGTPPPPSPPATAPPTQSPPASPPATAPPQASPPPSGGASGATPLARV
jgi:hypothetical protein